MVFNEIRVCVDCCLYIANGTLDDVSEERAREVKQGARRLKHASIGDGDESDTFSRVPCDCCGSTLAGAGEQAFTEDV